MQVKRRSFLKTAMAAGAATALTNFNDKVEGQVANAARGMAMPKIKDVTVIETAPAGSRLTVVKITTDQPGLYGYGCATFTQRADLVKPAVLAYLKPFVMGKPVDRIEDTWQAMYDSSYWKNGPVLNNAISGVDQALWDIKGRMAGMPVYDLVGGKCREAVDTYAHADGKEIDDVIKVAKGYMAQGWRHVRVQVGLPGMAGYGSSHGESAEAFRPLTSKPLFEPAYQFRRGLDLLREARKQLGDEVELLHDMHERLTPNEAVEFCKQAEPLRMFFLEDPLSPEDLDYFRQIRQQCATPIAMGELFNSPHEWQPLIDQRLIDYIRCHVSEVGGFTPARKIAILGELHGVRTAWHGPGDVSPIGHTAHCHLDLCSYNFGIQEYTPFNQATQEVFKDCPQMKNGYLWVSEKPGWGMEIDETLAAKYPYRNDRNGLNGGWGELRTLDGTVIKQ